MRVKVSLKIKITLMLLTISLPLGGVLAFVFYSGIKKEFEVRQLEDMRVLARHMGDELELIFSHSRDVTNVIAKQSEIANYVSSSDPEYQKEEILSLLKRYDIGNYFSAIYLMDSEGETLSSTQEDFVGENYGFRKYFSEALREGQGTQMAIGSTSGKSGYYFASRIGDSSGVAVVKLKTDSIEKVFEGEYPDGLTTMLVDRYGVVISASDDNLRKKFIGRANEEELQEANIRERFNQEKIDELEYNEVENWIRSFSEGKKKFEYTKEDKGSSQVLLAENIKDFPYYLVTKSNMKIVLSDSNRLALLLASLALICVFLISIFSYFYLSKLFRPLEELKKTAESIQSGNLEKRLEIKTGDEVEELNNALSKMVNDLIKARENIQKKVEKRTARLEKINKAMVDRELKMAELKKEIRKLKKEKDSDN
ncbi:MAG: cache domain-containing protein [Candidatus Moraniibacteriota bacterium]